MNWHRWLICWRRLSIAPVSGLKTSVAVGTSAKAKWTRPTRKRCANCSNRQWTAKSLYGCGAKIEGLRPLRERQALLARLEKEHTARRRTLLTEWEEVKAQEFRLLDRAARAVDRPAHRPLHGMADGCGIRQKSKEAAQ